jgi:site-specific DNA-methyltransferase (adenine-specific)
MDDFSELLNGDDGNEDDIPEIPEQPKCKEGDIWLLGKHKLLCGDALDRRCVEKVLFDNLFDLLIYDPPYDIKQAWSNYIPCDAAIVFTDYKHIKEAMQIAFNFENIYHFVWDGITSWYTPNRPLQRHKSAFVCMNKKQWNFNKAIYYDDKKRIAKTVYNTRGSCEYKPLLNNGVHLQTVYQHQNTNVSGDHKHAKPMQWIKALINGVSPEKGILDLFGGSGTTIMAAGDTPVYMIENDPLNCDVIIRRWEQTTNLMAIKN